MKIKVKEKFVDSISGKKIYANKAENTTNGLNIDDSISSLSSTIKTKQDKLTFAGEDNTITAINSSAIKVDLTDYYTKNETSGKDEISTALETKAYAIARVGGSGPLFGENMKFKFAPEGGTNLNLQEYDSSTDDWTDIGVIVTKENKGPNKILKTDNRNVLQWIDPDYYTKSETSAASSISAALDGKEDKIFVAEYDVTTYQELLDAYNAGKKIICNYYPEKESLPTYVIVLKFNEYSPIQGLFKFSVQTANNAFKYVQCTFNDGDTSNTTWHEETTSIDLSNYYTTAQTSAASEISAALTAKQDTLSAGINLKIDNGIIDIKNSGCSADATSIALGKGAEASGYSLCFGRADENKPHIASGEYCINLGWHSSAIGNYSTVLGGNYCLASGDIDPNDGKQYWGPIAQGGKTSAFGHYSHAEGIETIASGQAAHSEGYFTRAIGHVSHSDGLFTSAFAQGSYAHGNRTIASANYTFVIGTRNLNNSAAFVVGNGTSGDTSVDEDDIRSDAFVVDWNGNVSATGDMYTSAGQVVTDVMLTSATNSTTSFVTNGVADLTPLYTYIKSLEDRIAALEAAAVTLPVVNGDNPTVNGDNPII